MDRRAALLFAALGVAWGIPYLLVKVAVGELSPAALVLIRTSAAAALLIPLAAMRGDLRRTLRHWRPIAAYGAVEVVVPWLMIGHAEQRLASSTTGLLIAATPLVGVGLGLLLGRHEALGRSGWLGLALGFVGVAALVGLDIDTSDRVAVLQLLVTVVGYAIGPMILARYLSDQSGVAVVGLSFGAAAIGSLVVLTVAGGWPTAVPSTHVLASVAVLVVVCTVGAFLMLFALVGQVGAVRSTAVTYVNPAVAIVVGAIFLGESITTWTVVGFALVLVGSVLLTRRPPAAGDDEVLATAESEVVAAVEPWRAMDTGVVAVVGGATGDFAVLELPEAAAAWHSPRPAGGVVAPRRGRALGRRVGRPVLARRR